MFLEGRWSYCDFYFSSATCFAAANFLLSIFLLLVITRKSRIAIRVPHHLLTEVSLSTSQKPEARVGSSLLSNTTSERTSPTVNAERGRSSQRISFVPKNRIRISSPPLHHEIPQRRSRSARLGKHHPLYNRPTFNSTLNPPWVS
jgi:hypothetical protein